MERKEYRMIRTDLAGEISHGICVSNLARRVAEKLGLSDEECYQLAVAGLLHDVGKLEMAKQVDSQRRKNTLHVEELRYIRTHPALGYMILNEMEYPAKIAQMVLYHHENYDGSGYPANKSGEDIPLGARILRVCDVFAALISDRSYRKAFDMDTAVELMIEEVKNFDMKVFLAFLEVVHAPDIQELLARQYLDVQKIEYRDILEEE
ncbi:MAG: HD domain-containing phosphohydrolase [Eubacteriales bacterium]|nr:HD domain-containing phosphohydrolase [Eubacteriales bacterium]